MCVCDTLALKACLTLKWASDKGFVDDSVALCNNTCINLYYIDIHNKQKYEKTNERNETKVLRCYQAEQYNNLKKKKITQSFLIPRIKSFMVHPSDG